MSSTPFSYKNGKEEKTDIFLIYPPYIFPSAPPSSLVYLSSFLKKYGINTKLFDLSLEFFYYISSHQTIKKAIKLALKNARRNENMSLWNFLDVKTFCEKVDEAIEILKGKKFFNFKKYNEAYIILSQLFSLYNNIYPELKFSLISIFPERCKGKTSIAPCIKHIIKDPFLDFIDKFFRKNDELFESKLIGLSVNYESQLFPALIIADYMKKKNNKVKIVIGGSFFTKFCLEEFAEKTSKSLNLIFNHIDYGVLCEGETPLLSLYDAISNDKSFEGVPNLLHKENGKIKFTFFGPRENLNKLPTPDYTLLPIKKYLAPYELIPLHTSRGCYWDKCAFCSGHLNYSKRGYRIRPIEKIKEDIKTISKQFHSPIIMFTDAALHPETAQKISEIIIKEGLKVNWEIEGIRMDKNLSSEFIKKLEESNCVAINFGIESFTSRILEKMQKGVDLSKVIRNLEKLKYSDIWVKGSLILYFPEETEEERIHSINLAIKLLDSHVIFPLYIPYGSEIYNNPRKFGILNKNEFPAKIDDKVKEFYINNIKKGKYSAFWSKPFLYPHLYCFLAFYGKRGLKSIPQSLYKGRNIKRNDKLLLNPNIIYKIAANRYIIFTGYKIVILKGIEKYIMDYVKGMGEVTTNTLLNYLKEYNIKESKILTTVKNMLNVGVLINRDDEKG